MKKVLIVASVVSFIEWFNKENVVFLKDEMNCDVHIACNFDYMNDTDIDRTQAYISELKAKGIVLHNIEFARSPLSSKNIKAYKELRSIINNNSFDLIHCHTPTASMLTRIAARKARKKGSTVMYSCHGFHFHNAAPKKNWLIYYPIEKFLSRFCDFIVTINKEDFNRAKTFHCKNVRYIPSVGVDIKAIQKLKIDKVAKKESIGIPADKTLIISAGELIPRKNHEVIIRALGKIKREDIYYAIAGKGPLKDELIALAKELGVSERVMFLGFRTDVFELYHAADISAFPSKIEGLGLAGVEAMAAGVPLVSSNVHGILDYVIDGQTGYAVDPDDVDGFAEAIQKLADNSELREQMKQKCFDAVAPFELSNALNVMWEIYKEVLVK
ncbi:MAG: glycosyltransferase family 4 protein [Ruminococcaceae bacterium]|nr:glycosyltransferase family 4 protein [Oscillospiraceae bacterium]